MIQLSSPNPGSSSARDDRRDQHGENEDSPHETGAAQVLIEEQCERDADDDLDRDAEEGQLERVLDDRAEGRVVEELPVVAEPDPVPGLMHRVVPLERPAEACDQRVDGEDDEVDRARSEQEQPLAPPLERRGEGALRDTFTQRR